MEKKVLPDASAVSRGINDPKISFVTELREVPNFTFIPIDAELSNLACKFAAENKLRGCDAIYVAVSCMFKSKLITLDEEQKERASNVIEALTPMEELEL
ncbi:MAG: PIN domain-containing protein [Methanocellales archaeon]|nr:PIN domain-containing protein [Methanocellales archaeon]